MNSLPYCSISQIKNTLLNDEAFMSGQIQEAHHFKITAEILQIQCQRVMWYTACSQCKKKINPTQVGFTDGAYGNDEYG